MGLIVLFLEEPGFRGDEGGRLGKMDPSYAPLTWVYTAWSPEKRGSDGRRVAFLAEAKAVRWRFGTDSIR